MSGPVRMAPGTSGPVRMAARAADQHRAERQQNRKAGGAHALQLTGRRAPSAALRSATADHVVARVRHDAMRSKACSDTLPTSLPAPQDLHMGVKEFTKHFDGPGCR
jgi:hypothetical protein